MKFVIVLSYSYSRCIHFFKFKYSTQRFYMKRCQSIFSKEYSSSITVCVLNVQVNKRLWVQIVEPWYLSRCSAGLRAGGRGSRVRFPAGAGNFSLHAASRTALGPTQPLIHWVIGALFMAVKWQGREADHSPPSNFEVKECVELHLHSPIRLHGVVVS
jgi:hypothetical protein